MTKTVLIVDDEFSIYQMMSMFLQSRGYAVIWGKNGNEGYEKFMEERPEMIFSDVLMPQMNGPDMVKKIRGRFEGTKVPIVVMTSIEKSFSIERDAVNKWGATAFLHKPFDLPTLERVVKEYIGPPDADVGKTEKKPPAEAIEKPTENGSFSEKSYAKILNQLHMKRATGKLDISQGEDRIVIYFEEGNPINVDSNYLREGSLESILRRFGILTEPQLQEIKQTMEKQGLRIGEAVVVNGLLTPQQLSQALLIQAEEKLSYPFLWDKGEYSFSEMAVVKDPELSLNTPLCRIILNSVTRFYSDDRIRSSFDGKLLKPFGFNPKTNHRIEDFALRPEEQAVVSMAKSGTTIKEVLKHSKIGPTRTYQILYVLFLLGVCKFKKGEDDSEQGRIEPGAQSTISVANWLSSEVSDEKAEYYYERGVGLLNENKYEGAVECFLRAIGINNRRPRYFVKMAWTLHRLPDREDIIDLSPSLLLERAVNLDRDCADAHYTLGIISKEKKEFSKALMYFERAHESDPDHPEAQLERKLMKMRLRRENNFP